MTAGVSRAEFEKLAADVAAMKEDGAEAKLTSERNYERIFASLKNIEEYIKRDTSYDRDRCQNCKAGIDSAVAEIKDNQKSHGERITKLEVSAAKWIGAAVLLSAIMGLGSGFLIKAIFG